MNHRILLIEDEPGLVLTLTHRLGRDGYALKTVSDGETGLAHALKNPFDLIILDVMLPSKNGFEVCRDLRQHGVGVPILMLTARGQLADKVQGLKIGADDYLTKPFEMAELQARIEALLRRVSSPRSKSLERHQFGDICVDFRSAETTRKGKRVELSAREFQLLRYFIQHRGAMLSRDELINEVWGYDAMPVTRTVDVHVAWLRRKIEPNPGHPQFILTIHRLGYKFVG